MATPAEPPPSNAATSSSAVAASSSLPSADAKSTGDPDFSKGDSRKMKRQNSNRRACASLFVQEDGESRCGRRLRSCCSPCLGSDSRHSLQDMLLYFLDRVFVKRWAFFLFLTVVGLVMIGVFGLIYALVVAEDWTALQSSELNIYIEGVWAAWTFMADPGTHADVRTTSQRVLGSIITLGGILFFASILGVTVDIIHEKMDALRQGKSKIVESGHTLILGWTEKTFHIVEELVEANSSEGGGVIAILANEAKERMEEELKIQIPVSRRRGTRVVVRTGSPLVVNDLIRVSVHMAKAVIILASSGDADRSDADTLRAMLSLRNMYQMSQGAMLGYVVAEVRDIDNEPLVKMVGSDSVETLVSHDMIGRLMLMSVRQPGLAKVYEALLGFEGDEFYMSEWKELQGKQWQELVGMFHDAVPIGILGADGFVTLNPRGEQKLKNGDQVIVIAQDNDTYKPLKEPIPVETGTPPALELEQKKREKILFCGWRRDVRDILFQLDKLVDPGSEVHMMTHCVPIDQRNVRLLEDGLDVNDLGNIKLVHHYGNTSVRRKLEVLKLEHYSSIMIFADQLYEADTMHADSHSLATLLLIRNIQAVREAKLARGEGGGRDSRKLSSVKDHACPMICEILDPHTQKTIAESDHLSLASDFCQSNRLIAQVMTMVAEERTVKVLLGELLGSQGVCIHVVPSARYTRPGEHVSFWTLQKRAMTYFNETVIGYQLRNSAMGTVLNPPGKDKPYIWDRCDFAILQGEMSKATYFLQKEEPELPSSPATPATPPEVSVPISQGGAQDAQVARPSKPSGEEPPRALEPENTHDWDIEDREARDSLASILCRGMSPQSVRRSPTAESS